MMPSMLRSKGGTLDLSVVCSALVLLLVMHVDAQTWSLQTSSRVAVASACLSLFVVARRTDRGLWSPSALFLLILTLFHVGLLVFLVLGVEPYLPNEQDTVWLYGPNAGRAGYLVSVALLTYGAAACLGVSNRYRTVYESDEDLEIALSRAGATLLTSGCIAWFLLTAAAGGVRVFGSSYSTFLAATSTVPLTYVYLAIGVGLSLLMLRPHARFSKVALAAFVVFAVVALPLGLRGEVLFPAVGSAAVLAYRRALPRALPVLVIAVVLLSAVSVLKQVRQVGIVQASASVESISPSRGLSELGYTFRVLVETVGWHERGHEKYLRYETYWAPVDRQLLGPALGRDRVDVRSDPRVMNVEVRARVGAIGGSLIAEAHHNDGLRGIVIVVAGLGYGLARLSVGRLTTYRLALIAVTLVPLLNHVRNSFVPVPASCLLGLALVSSVLVCNRLSRRRLAAPEAYSGSALKAFGSR